MGATVIGVFTSAVQASFSRGWALSSAYRITGLESERSNEPSDTQRLHLLNSSHIQKKIEDSNRLRTMVRAARRDRRRLIRALYLNILSRFPTETELAAAQEYFKTDGVNAQQAVNDLAWALINTKEFLYRH